MSRDEFHPDAHPEATEITGPCDYGEWGQCVAESKQKDRRCYGYALGSHGKCYSHGGKTPTKDENPNQGAPDNNGNAESHGLRSDGEKWFERHRDECEDDVRRMVAAWMDLAPFGWEVTGNVVLLCDAAINEAQVRSGDRYIDAEGTITEEKVVAGEAVIVRDTDNPAFRYKTQLQRTTLQILNKLGILDSPESQQAEAISGLASDDYQVNKD